MNRWMKKSTKLLLAIIFFVLLGSIIIGLYYKYTSQELQTIFNLATLLGLYVSIYGLGVTLWQIIALQNITESTKSAVTETREKIEQILSISDIAKIVTTIRIIEEYINSEKYELAKLRLCDVKDFMMRIEFISNIKFDKDDFGRLKKRVEIGLNNLDKQMSNKGKLDKVVFCQDMEEIASMLSQLENQLKSK